MLTFVLSIFSYILFSNNVVVNPLLCIAPSIHFISETFLIISYIVTCFKHSLPSQKNTLTHTHTEVAPHTPRVRSVCISSKSDREGTANNFHMLSRHTV